MNLVRRGFLQIASSALALAAMPQISAAETRLLDPIVQLRLTGNETFIAAEEFRVDKKIGGRILSATGWNFAEHFLDVNVKQVGDVQVSAWNLLYSADDNWILNTLHGEADGNTHMLAHIYRLMALGENGPSHIDGRTNLAYVRSPIDKKLWAINWSVNNAKEWIIGAAFVPHPQIGWPAGSRVFTSHAVAM